MTVTTAFPRKPFLFLYRYHNDKKNQMALMSSRLYHLTHRFYGGRGLLQFRPFLIAAHKSKDRILI